MNATPAPPLSLDQMSLNNLKLQQPINAVDVFLNLVGFVANLLLFIFIARNKSMRNNFFLCILHISASDGLYCFTCVVFASSHLYLLSLGLPETTTPLSCMPFFLLPFIFQNASPVLALCVAIDRLFGVASPVTYHTFNVKRLQMINVVAWIYSIVLCSVGAVTQLNGTQPISNCVQGKTFLPAMNNIVTYGAITAHSLTILLYVGLIALLIYRLKEASKNGKNIAELKETFQYKATITGFLAICTYAFFYLVSEVWIALLYLITDRTLLAEIAPLTTSFMAIGCTLNAVLFMSRSSIIREGIAKLFPCGATSNAVVTLTSKKKVAFGAQPAAR